MTKRRIRHIGRIGHRLAFNPTATRIMVAFGEYWAKVAECEKDLGVSSHWLQDRAKDGLVSTFKADGGRRYYLLRREEKEDLPIQQHLKAVAKGKTAAVFEDDAWTTHTGDGGRVTRVLKSVADAKPGLDQERIHSHLWKVEKVVHEECESLGDMSRRMLAEIEEQRALFERVKPPTVDDVIAMLGGGTRKVQLDNSCRALVVGEIGLRTSKQVDTAVHHTERQGRITRRVLIVLFVILAGLLITILFTGCGDGARKPTTDAEDATEVADSDCVRMGSCYEMWEVSCGWHADGCGGLVDCGECEE